jgi:hypothetical protein
MHSSLLLSAAVLVAAKVPGEYFMVLRTEKKRLTYTQTEPSIPLSASDISNNTDKGPKLSLPFFKSVKFPNSTVAEYNPAVNTPCSSSYGEFTQSTSYPYISLTWETPARTTLISSGDVNDFPRTFSSDAYPSISPNSTPISTFSSGYSTGCPKPSPYSANTPTWRNMTSISTHSTIDQSSTIVSTVPTALSPNDSSMWNISISYLFYSTSNPILPGYSSRGPNRSISTFLTTDLRITSPSQYIGLTNFSTPQISTPTTGIITNATSYSNILSLTSPTYWNKTSATYREANVTYYWTKTSTIHLCLNSTTPGQSCPTPIPIPANITTPAASPTSTVIQTKTSSSTSIAMTTKKNHHHSTIRSTKTITHIVTYTRASLSALTAEYMTTTMSCSGCIGGYSTTVIRIPPATAATSLTVATSLAPCPQCSGGFSTKVIPVQLTREPKQITSVVSCAKCSYDISTVILPNISNSVPEITSALSSVPGKSHYVTITKIVSCSACPGGTTSIISTISIVNPSPIPTTSQPSTMPGAITYTRSVGQPNPTRSTNVVSQPFKGAGTEAIDQKLVGLAVIVTLLVTAVSALVNSWAI